MPRQSKQIKQRPVVTPIFQSSTFVFPDMASFMDYQRGRRKGYIYSRYDNPTVETVERRISGLDGAERSLVFSSGMAAISSACLSLVGPGDEIASSFPLYGGTAALFGGMLKKLGIIVRFFPADDFRRLGRIISERTRLIYLESPTNPTLKIIDLEMAAGMARSKRIFSLIDSTFATPVNQKPLEFGIDAVVHSVTKYLAGHSDIVGGALSGSKVFISKAWEARKYLGGCADPHQAFLLERGLKTLEVRVEKHNSNAGAIASYLERRPELKRVIYPGLNSHAQHELAAAQMNGFGGIVSFDLGTERRAVRFVDSLKVIMNAASLGGTESLVSIPIWSSHYGLKKSELAKSGITPGLVRLSVGLEDEKVLIRDIDQAMRRAFKS